MDSSSSIVNGYSSSVPTRVPFHSASILPSKGRGIKGVNDAVKEEEGRKNEGVDKDDTQGKLGIRELNDQEQVEVRELKRTDRAVKMHEMAHMAAGGQYAGGARYTFKTGSDGKRYAVGGEVSIDVSKEKDPERTVQKMAQVRRAALAPANPSAADRTIAAKATQRMAQARLEIIQQQMEERHASTEKVSSREIADGIISYKRHQELFGLNGNDSETNPTSQSTNIVAGGIEKLRSNQIILSS